MNKMELKKEFVKFEKGKNWNWNWGVKTYDLDRHGRHLELDDTCLATDKRDFLNNLIFGFTLRSSNKNERGSSCRSQFVLLSLS